MHNKYIINKVSSFYFMIKYRYLTYYNKKFIYVAVGY